MSESPYSQSTLTEPADRSDEPTAENKAFMAALDGAVNVNEPVSEDMLPDPSVAVIR